MVSDIAPLANAAAAFLSTFLPQLAAVSEAAADEVGTRIAGGAFGLAKTLWVRIRGGLPEPERIERAAAVLEQAPDDGSARAMAHEELRRQLVQVLTTDPSVVAVIREVLGQPEDQQVEPVPREQYIGHQQTGPVYGGTSYGIGQQVNNPA